MRTLEQLLRSLARHDRDRAVVVFDLGLTDRDRDRLSARAVRQRVEILPFPFDSYPAHLRTLATCGWKPIVIERILTERGGLLLWLDAASLVHEPLDTIFHTIAADGVLTLAGRSPARRWCHPHTFDVMGTPDVDREKRCRAGGVLGFDGSRSVVRDLVAGWRDRALDADCLEPPGASRANHRYDQAVLTNLLHAFEREGRLALRDDEVDISSTRPVRWVSTRNFVAGWVPSIADPLVRGWYATVKAVDRLVLSMKDRDAAS